MLGSISQPPPPRPSLLTPSVCSATSMALMGPPLAGSLPPSMLCSLVQALASRPLPPSCRASYTGGWAGCGPTCILGQNPERCPPLPAPLLPVSISRLTSFPLLFLLLLFFGVSSLPLLMGSSLPLPPHPPSLSPALFSGVLRNLILTPNSKSPPLTSPQTPEEKARLSQLPALLDG